MFEKLFSLKFVIEYDLYYVHNAYVINKLYYT